ncbi:hypothetical protein N2152v2_005010 [Parachlorella kessleri]
MVAGPFKPSAFAWDQEWVAPGYVTRPGTAIISDLTAERFGGSSVHLQLSAGSDCVLLARVFQSQAGEPFDLVDLEAEVSLLGRQEGCVEVDAQALAQEFLRQYFGRVAAVNEACVLEREGHQLLLRVSATNTLNPSEQEECIGYHCYRGLVTPDTQVYLVEVPGGIAAEDFASAATRKGDSGAEQEAATGAAEGLDDAAGPAREGHGRTAGDGGANGGMHSAQTVLQQQQQRRRQQQQRRQQCCAPPGAGLRGSCKSSGVAPAVGALPQSALQGRTHVKLRNARKRDAVASSGNTVKVITNDGEWFSVKRKLLRSCITLTTALRSEGEAGLEITVDVDTLTFDRVLIFLEAEALGKPQPSFAGHLIPPLLQAAGKLGLRSLQEFCHRTLGEMEARVRVHSLEEIQGRNSQGECLLVMDGMVLDVTRWLPQHPGGSAIITRHALNIDCSRLFELYHHSRESFLYLQEFYVGEVRPDDRANLPLKEPSADFLQQLREYTSWRLQPEEINTAA